MRDSANQRVGEWLVRKHSAAVALLALVVLIGGVRPAIAQVDDGVWGEPVNLSRSGAATLPQIAAAPDGTLQAFWWDQFDGLMTTISDGAIFAGGAWSEPALAPILVTVVVR